MAGPPVRRLVVKLGSALVTGGEGFPERLAADVAALRAQGTEVILVSSGAVALGRDLLGLPKSPRLDQKQAAAAAGQPLLMQAWGQAFAPVGLVTAQLLLTANDTEDRRAYLNARGTLAALLAAGAVPIINENDSTATAELRVGDNDRLSARVAQLAGADTLVLLSDIDGLYTADPRRDPAAEHLPHVAELTPDILALAGDTDAAGPGTGGMRTKLEAAQIAAAAGCVTLIGSGAGERPLARLIAGDARHTAIAAHGSPASAYKAWIAGTLKPVGSLRIDAGAAAALARGSSLLPAGVTAVEGRFGRGDCLVVLSPDGRELARGLARYDADEAVRLVGKRGSAIAEILGYSRGDALIHRDDMVLR
ncbi:glutamate 5-kinase [Sphingomonas astaxanthinifaciens]|uniref:Glutamate 5-kinase n=1 Tax=Sphingomonas astaxanthinifaciens DSM 22298 TaxID=1123267 RepID=A0ABQ5Z857_9SPHN|nr:glutamate 5-kinase [Sphingomonas astaxanthinifaciens]GLR47711.1 glutamate 5-kinase [Sphingomonas astaxanthinifaciens DSM 22298]